jgi:hypothetical protein
MDEAKARAILGKKICEDNGLDVDASGDYVAWTPGQERVMLDAGLTADELEAIAWWMRNSKAR